MHTPTFACPCSATPLPFCTPRRSSPPPVLTHTEHEDPTACLFSRCKCMCVHVRCGSQNGYPFGTGTYSSASRSNSVAYASLRPTRLDLGSTISPRSALEQNASEEYSFQFSLSSFSFQTCPHGFRFSFSSSIPLCNRD